MKIKVYKNDIYNIYDLLMYLSILTLGCGNINGLLPLNLTQIIIILLFFSIFLKQLYYKEVKIPKIILILSIYIFSVTFIINKNDIESLKTFSILIIYLYTCYFYILQTNFNKLMKMLYNISYLVSLIAIIQEVGYFLNISFLYDYSYLGINNAISLSGSFMRVTSILTEPAHLSNLLLPGICLTILDLINKYKISYVRKSKNFIIILASTLTFSTIVYITLLGVFIYYFIFLIKGFGKKVSVFFIFLLGIMGILVIFKESLYIIQEKIQSFYTLEKLNTTNLSSFAIISNLKIAIEKFKDMYFFGTGIDTHAKSYYDYIHTLYSHNDIILYLNYDDASSIYIRILSEFGIFGLINYFLFLIKMVLVKEKKNYWKDTFIVNRIAVIGIVMYGIRIGNYINSYFILLLMISILTYRNMKEDIIRHN